ncbi:glycosyltransferase family 8 protein [Novosphingobium mathurense]|jgi:lipopolysaccharide biosynthesis glycosyltransferase|uniref:Lipopolysaccharide biosynthesis protein, LPS:glycosyltransferase n=1 Tax=Novosphingobium mathurense TaxID=428990 RepID=A0A1U6HMV1_9SPHN|nr:glycosyltransferase [Novosphingobium mathurense]SLJ96941.1 Lipopolysaccharide biosynthesis protein, LPS:glycosyltransferase [Novosphingobium mathurense]
MRLDPGLENLACDCKHGIKGDTLTRQCIAFVTDENFFLPTFVAAILARKHCSRDTDVVITFTEASVGRHVAQDLCARENIVFQDTSAFFTEQLSVLDKSKFAGRISIAAMGRLLLPAVLPEIYEQIIYLDGDVQVVGPLDYLENYRVPEGKFLAALDYVPVLSVLKGASHEDYFNSGVIKFNRKGWIGRRAFDFFVENGGAYHDQGALNAVKGDAWIPISNKWNFPRQFMHLVDDGAPAIIHYMSHPKPWDGVFFPWSRREHDVYRDYLKKYPQLRRFRRSISLARRALYRFRSWDMRRRNEYRHCSARLASVLY